VNNKKKRDRWNKNPTDSDWKWYIQLTILTDWVLDLEYRSLVYNVSADGANSLDSKPIVNAFLMKFMETFDGSCR
jgi:hypothetical protein